ncbi:hypothetical protein BCR42DRAFT_478578 [Absidia repens]|uniref:SH3 domain-containing protein n=1 Tax=Absidia repens TaxID=90262 RepID=A0A1X2IK67_9FUNG|nr:hypothetical protein BCR42DRAFT_478578 [Absidia repens]
MLKNFGKFKQWTGERLGAAKATLQTGGFQQLEEDTEKKRTGFEKVHEATEQVYGQLSKKKPSVDDAKTKCLPWESLASCWISHGSTFPDDNPLGAALINLGQTEARIALLQDDFANTIKCEYMDVLKQGLQHYKDYDTLKKKLESKRLDYDAKLTRLQKSKKEKPEWELEMQTAKTKYGESESDVIQKMIILQEYEGTQLAYYQRCVELINELRDHMPNPEVCSVTTLTTRFFANDSTHSLLTPTNNPSATSKSHRKAIFNFQGNATDELSFNIGDVITVIEPMDEGWWMGEMEQIEPKRKGIFPVNYTEDIMLAPPTMPTRPPHVMKKYILQEQQEETRHGNVDYMQIQQDASPFNDTPTSASSSSSILPSTPAFRSKPTNVPSRRGTSPTPLTRPSLIETNLASRESTHATPLSPPPPPPSHSFTPSNNPVSSTRTKTLPPPPPSSRIKIVPILSQNVETPLVANCKECGCDDYSANLFKKGHCNNCFHEHNR